MAYYVPARSSIPRLSIPPSFRQNTRTRTPTPSPTRDHFVHHSFSGNSHAQPVQHTVVHHHHHHHHQSSQYHRKHRSESGIRSERRSLPRSYSARRGSAAGNGNGNGSGSGEGGIGVGGGVDNDAWEEEMKKFKLRMNRKENVGLGLGSGGNGVGVGGMKDIDMSLFIPDPVQVHPRVDVREKENRYGRSRRPPFLQIDTNLANASHSHSRSRSLSKGSKEPYVHAHSLPTSRQLQEVPQTVFFPFDPQAVSPTEMGVIPSRVAYAVPPHTLPPATLPISAPRRLGSISKSGSGSGRRLESATLGGIGTLNTDFVFPRANARCVDRPTGVTVSHLPPPTPMSKTPITTTTPKKKRGHSRKSALDLSKDKGSPYVVVVRESPAKSKTPTPTPTRKTFFEKKSTPRRGRGKRVRFSGIDETWIISHRRSQVELKRVSEIANHAKRTHVIAASSGEIRGTSSKGLKRILGKIKHTLSLSIKDNGERKKGN